MSRFLGVVRLIYKAEPVLDVLYDTSDSEGNLSTFTTVCYSEQFYNLFKVLKNTYPRSRLTNELGTLIEAF